MCLLFSSVFFVFFVDGQDESIHQPSPCLFFFWPYYHASNQGLSSTAYRSRGQLVQIISVSLKFFSVV